jgi:hypothetical protein
MMTELDMTILYGFLAVFDAGLEYQFNDWTDQHWAQGFSWRPGTVSFRTMNDWGGASLIKVLDDEKLVPTPDAQRAIVVPFSIGPAGTFTVATFTDMQKLMLPSGNYALLFETGFGEKREEDDETPMWFKLTFVSSASRVEPRILVADSELSPKYPLLMTAEPA